MTAQVQTQAAAAAPVRPGLWIGDDAALFDHKCDRPDRDRTEYYVSAPCLVLAERGAFRTDSALGAATGDPATVVFHNTLAPYTVAELPGQPSRALTVRLSRGAFRDLMADVDPASADAGRFAIASAPLPGAAALMRAMLRRRLGQEDALGIEESVLRLGAAAIAGLASARPRERVTSKAREHVAAARELLARRGCEPLRLKDVARGSGCSPWHLARVFRAVTGTTIARHVTALRLRAALERVLDSNESLTGIALACGFADHSHFTGAFRREYGITPSAARAGQRDFKIQP
jgi:AraC family transcriptional regulator